MKTLETELRFAGHQLRQIWRQADVAVYERSFPGKPAHELELVTIQVTPAAVLPSGATIAEQEAYPGSSKWGRLGWSFPVRYRDIVLRLAEKLVAISQYRGHFVRRAVSDFKLTATM